MVFAAVALDLDVSKGGGALGFAGLVIGLTGLGCALAFRRDADKLDALARGEGLLARWLFSPGEWSKFRAREELEESSSKRGLATMVTVISLAIGIPYAVAAGEAGIFILGVLALVCALCWGLAIYVPAHRLAPHDDAGPVEVLIGRDGVYLPGEFHCWTSFAAQLRDARVRAGRDPVVQIEYRIYQRHGWNTYEIRVPIPAGALAEAERVCATLMEASPALNATAAPPGPDAGACARARAGECHP